MDRNEFAERLNGIVIPEGTPQEEINTLMRPISEAIAEIMPDSLFRFRPFGHNSYDAFRDGIIYAVTADMFNDPYDTLASYDIVEIEKGINAVMNIESLEQLKNWLAHGNDFPEYIKQRLPVGLADALTERLLSLKDIKSIKDRVDENRQGLLSSIELLFPVLAEISKRFSTIACFCESIQSVLMWSHYSDSHRGFALEYNFKTTLNHPLKNVGIFPIIYGDERPDASSFIAWEYLFIMGIKTPNPDISSSIKNALYKSSTWAYEKEWRLIDTTPRDGSAKGMSAIPFEPVAIYYGQYISRENKQQLHIIAQEKGIKEFEMYVDYSSPVYEMKYRPASFT